MRSSMSTSPAAYASLPDARDRLHMSAVSPKQFGAVADGNAANSALDVAGILAAIATGRSVDFGGPENHYMIDASIPVANKSHNHYFGFGARLESTAPGIPQMLNFSSNNAYLKVYGLAFDGSGASGTYTADEDMGIRLTDSRAVSITGCFFEGFTGDAIQGAAIGGTGAREEGPLIADNIFRDGVHDPTTYSQTSIRLKANCEYTRVVNNAFYDVVRAARFSSGANSVFSDNIIMGCTGVNWNGSTVLRTNALFYAGPSSNAGKIRVSGNTFNHNEVDCIPIILQGDVTKPQNVSMVLDNHLIVNGDANVQTHIYLEDTPGVVVRGNHIRYNGGGGTGDMIYLDNCDGARVSQNFVQRGGVGIRLLNSNDVIITADNDITATTPVLCPGSSSIALGEKRMVGFRCTSAGTGINPFPFVDMTIAKTATGTYELTHALGTSVFTFTAMPEISGLIANYAITATTVTVTFEDAAGTLADTDWLGHIECPKGTRVNEI